MLAEDENGETKMAMQRASRRALEKFDHL